MGFSLHLIVFLMFLPLRPSLKISFAILMTSYEQNAESQHIAL